MSDNPLYIYLLFGMTGVYSDTIQWVVSVFNNEHLALKARDELRELLTKYNAHHEFVRVLPCRFDIN